MNDNAEVLKKEKTNFDQEVETHIELLNKFGLYTFLSSLTKNTPNANNLMMAALDVLLKNIESANYQKIRQEIIENIHAMYRR